MTPETINGRQFDFLSILTGVVVVAYLGAAVYALVAQKISFEAFAAAVGAPVSTLLGFWVGRR